MQQSLPCSISLSLISFYITSQTFHHSNTSFWRFRCYFNRAIFLCLPGFFLLHCFFNNCTTKVELAIAIPTGAPIAVANEILEKPTAADKASKDRSTYSNDAIYLSTFFANYFSFTNNFDKIIFYFINPIKS